MIASVSACAWVSGGVFGSREQPPRGVGRLRVRGERVAAGDLAQDHPALRQRRAEQVERPVDLRLGRLAGLGELGRAHRLGREEQQRLDDLLERAHPTPPGTPGREPEDVAGFIVSARRPRSGSQVASPRLCSSSNANRVTAWVSLSSSPKHSSKSIDARAGEQLAQHPKAPLERDGRADVAGVGLRRQPQQVADRDREQVRARSAGGRRRAPPGAAPAAAAPSGTRIAGPRRTARRGARRRRGSGGTRASVRAAPRPPPRARARARSSSGAGSSRRDLSSSSEAIRTRNSVAASRSSSPCSSTCSR